MGRRQRLMALVALTLVALALTGCDWTVAENHVGVRILWGKMWEGTVDEGFHPISVNIAALVEVPLQAQTYEESIRFNDAQAALSSDRQSVGYRINVAWRVRDPNDAWLLVRELGRRVPMWESGHIVPAMTEAMKEVFGRYTLEEFIDLRAQISDEIEEEFEAKLNEGLVEQNTALNGAIQINQIRLRNFDFNDDLERQINSTMVAEEAAKTAMEELERATYEFQQRVREAAAQRDADIERARGESLARLINARARMQEFQAIGSVGVDPNFFQFLQEWSGELPRIVTGDSLGMILHPGESGGYDTERVSLILGQLDAEIARTELGMTSSVASLESLAPLSP